MCLINLIKPLPTVLRSAKDQPQQLQISSELCNAAPQQLLSYFKIALLGMFAWMGVCVDDEQQYRPFFLSDLNCSTLLTTFTALRHSGSINKNATVLCTFDTDQTLTF